MMAKKEDGKQAEKGPKLEPHQVILRPLVTEKGTHQTQQSQPVTNSRPARGGAYTFEVHPDATKPMIRQAVEKIYNVKVRSVRTANQVGKSRRYRYKIGRTRAWKKAVVVLDADSHIDLF